jgi:hypothetical protein
LLEIERSRRPRRHARAFCFCNGERRTERIGSRSRLCGSRNFRKCRSICERSAGRLIIRKCRKFGWRSGLRIENKSVSASKMDEGSHANGSVCG